MLQCILRIIPKKENNMTTTIVYFGGGTGHLAVPLAFFQKNCKVVVVDFNKKSIDLLHQKAQTVMQEMKNNEDKQQEEESKDIVNDDPILRFCGKNKEGSVLSNLYTFNGPLEDFHESYDVAVALHLCGEATDVCIHKSIQNKYRQWLSHCVVLENSVKRV
jgi:hypothetical protein